MARDRSARALTRVVAAVLLSGCAHKTIAGDTDVDTDLTVDTGTAADTDPSVDTAVVDTDTDASTACVWTASSTLEGVTMVGGDVSCTWSVAAADLGVVAPFSVEIVSAIDVDVPHVSCAGPEKHGLVVQAWVKNGRDGADVWCPGCDLGRCAPNTSRTSTALGSWPDTFTWRPRRWNGPSDYGAEPGELFEPGTYLLQVFATGTRVSDGTPWRVALSAPVTLTP